MANIVKYLMFGDSQFKGGVKFTPVTPANVPTPDTGHIVVFVDSTNSNKLSQKDDTGTVSEIGSGSGGSGTYQNEIIFESGSFEYPDTNPAPLDRDTGTNGTILRQLFIQGTETFVLGEIKIPADVSPAATVTFKAIGYLVTVDSGKNIKLSFSHSAKNVSESWDGAYTAVNSADTATKTVQDQLDYITWTETVTNLGWSANDIIRFKLSRIAAGSNDSVQSWGLVLFSVTIPKGE